MQFRHCVDTELGSTRRNLAVKIQSSHSQQRLGRGSAAAAAEPCAPQHRGPGWGQLRAAAGFGAGAGHGAAAGLGAQPAAPRGAETAKEPRPLPARRVVRAAGEASSGRRVLAGSGGTRPSAEPLPGPGAARTSLPLSLGRVCAATSPCWPGPAPALRGAAHGAFSDGGCAFSGGRAGGTGRRRLPAASLSAAGEGAARGLC